MVWQADRVARRASCFFLLAALLWCLPALAIRPDSLENRVGGCGHPASGQASAAASQTVENAMGCGGCGYENASGQGRWLNRDPRGERGGINLYRVMRNNPLRWVDPFGLQGAGAVGASGVEGDADDVDADALPTEQTPISYPKGTMPVEKLDQALDYLENHPLGDTELRSADPEPESSLNSPSPKPSPKASCPPTQVNPGTLRLPPTRSSGADPFKLSQQMKQYGSSTEGMPPIQVTQDQNGEMMINDGVTRASRIDTYNQMNSTVNSVPVMVIEQTSQNLSTLPTVAKPQ